MRRTPAKEITFDGQTFYYLRNKANVLLYTGRSRKNDYDEVLLVVQHDPDKNTYYILFMIKHVVKWSGWSDVDDEEFLTQFHLTKLTEWLNQKCLDIVVKKC